MKVVRLETDSNAAALEAVDELRDLVKDGTVTEFAVAGANLKGEVTTLVTPLALPFAVIGALAALQMKIGVQSVESIRTEFDEL